MRLKLPGFLSVLMLSLFLLSCRETTAGESRPNRPNILFILDDDHATLAISSYNGLFADYAQTKNSDRPAAGEMPFSQPLDRNKAP